MHRALQIDALADELLVVSYDPNIEPANKRVITKNTGSSLDTGGSDTVIVCWLPGDADQPLQVLHKQVDLATLSDEALDALQRFTDRMIEHQPASDPVA